MLFANVCNEIKKGVVPKDVITQGYPKNATIGHSNSAESLQQDFKNIKRKIPLLRLATAF